MLRATRPLIHVSSSRFPVLARRHARRFVSSLLAEAHANHTGDRRPPPQNAITSKLHFINSVNEDGSQIPMYRVLDGAGKVIEGAEVPEIDEALARRMNTFNAVRRPFLSIPGGFLRGVARSTLQNTFFKILGYTIDPQL